MKKFRFGLDSVLEYRRQVLEELQGEYARALDLVRLQESKKADAERRYHDLNRRFRDEAAQGITVADAMGYENGLRLLENEIAHETKLLLEYRAAADEKRSRVMQAHIDTTILDKLREKQFQEYQKAVQKSDEQFIDEIVSAAKAVQNAQS